MKLFDSNYRVNKDIAELDLIVDEQAVFFKEKNLSVFGMGALLISKDTTNKVISKNDLTLSTFINTRPREITKDGKNYILKYFGGDKFLDVEDGEVYESEISIDNQEFFFKKMSAGHIAPMQTINSGFASIVNNIDLNVSLAVPHIIKEFYAANVFRYAKDPSLPARVKGSDDYIILSTRNKVAYGSTSTALAFEDPTAMILVNALDKKKKEKVTYREEYMML